MDSFELNKIAGAVLFALLVGFGLSIFSDILFETEVPETPGYIIAVAETEGGGEAAEGEAGPQPIAALLASADPAAGEASFRKCAACHTAEEGGANKVGPNLWNVVNRPIASHEGFAYSDALIAFSNNQQEVWDYDHLSNFLHDPKGTVPGTKMAFAGLKQDAERANVIAYLRSLSASPAPLPEPPAPEAAAAAEGEAAPAAAEQPAGGAEAPGSSEQPQAAPEGQANPQEQASPAAGGAGPASQAGAPVNPLSNVPAEQQGGATQPEAPSGATPTGPTEGAVPPTAAPAEGAAPAPAAPAAPAPAPAEPAPAAPPAPAPEQQGAAPQAAPAGQQAAAGSPFAQLVAQADPAAGEAAARKCIACHTFEEGGANKVGPHLFGVVGRPIAAVEDFNYSDPMREFSEGGAKVWDVDTLGTYLENPRGVVPGTKMVFAGLKREDERAATVAYLSTLGGTAAAAPQR